MNLKTTFIFVAIMLCSAAFANPIDLLERSTSETERREDGFITVDRNAGSERSPRTNHEPYSETTNTQDWGRRSTSWDNRRRNWHTDGNHEPFSRATEDLLENAESEDKTNGDGCGTCFRRDDNNWRRKEAGKEA
uniref:Secreted protein n=1 Tax=Moniliophthora roreri TaxID=221103 RepID=A0A0W0EZT3_MONRR